MSNQLEKVEGEKFLWKRRAKGVTTYYLRKRTETEDTEISLKTGSIKQACKLRDAWVNSQTNQELGITAAPKKKKRLRISKALEDYLRAGCPSLRRGKLKYPGRKHLRTEQDAVETLCGFFKTKYADELDADLLDDYHDWRKDNVARGDGDRTCDLELNTLSKALDWAVRKKKLDVNPIKTRTRYYDPKGARHAKQFAASNTEELHKVAAMFFETPQSECLGWQFLWESNFGMRTEEAIKLRRDAKSTEEPGFIQGVSMYVRRADKNTLNPAIYLHPEGLVLLEAMNAWAAKRYPDNPYYFPGRERSENGAVSHDALTKGLDRLFNEGRTSKKLTSHGGRAFYVLVRRSNGIGDSQIAIELNQVGGLETLRTSYGVVPQHWLDGKGPHHKWLPAKKEDYAWNALFTKLGLKVGEAVPAPAD
jgi:hypothetical protein